MSAIKNLISDFKLLKYTKYFFLLFIHYFRPYVSNFYNFINKNNKRNIIRFINIYTKYNKNNLYIFNNYGAGDTYHLFYLLKSYLKKKNINPNLVYIFGKEKNFILSKLFTDLKVNNIKVDKSINLHRLFYGFKYDHDKSNIIVPHVNHVNNCDGLERFSQFFGFSDKHLMSYLLTGQFDLESNEPNLNQINNIEISNKSIMIIPEANTHPNIDNQFWELLIEEFIKDNYTVYINKSKFTEATSYKNESFKIIEWDIDDLAKQINNFKLIIGIQCGLTNILLNISKKNNFVLVNNTFEKTLNFSKFLKLKKPWPFFFPEKFLYPANQAITYNFNGDIKKSFLEILKLSKFILKSDQQAYKANYTPIIMSLGETLDRISILKIKIELLNNANTRLNSLVEMRHLMEIINFDKMNEQLKLMFEELYVLNKKAWIINENFYKYDSEQKISEKDLVFLGKKIIEAQNINKERISVKNKISEKFDNTIFLEGKSFN